MTYRLAYRLTENRYEHLLERGWRRFGRTLFRPVCAACSACRSLRIVLRDFQPSRSQRRCRNQNQDVTLVIRRPSVTAEHISLYNRYHQDMHQRRNWPFREITSEQYFESFLDGSFGFAREFQYRSSGQLVGLGLVDVTPHIMSSIYFFHDPEWRDAALGTYSVLKEVEDGQLKGRDWLYMGYYIRDCGSMNYKSRFRPHELLKHMVSDEEEPVWSRPDDAKDSDDTA